MPVSSLQIDSQAHTGIGSNSRVERAHLQWVMWRQASQARMGPRDQIDALVSAAELSGAQLRHQ